MSYLRGETYIWSDGDRFHIWVADGYDEWDESDWGHGQAASAEAHPSGVGISGEVMDAFVMMRLAEMIELNLVDSAVDRALVQGSGNGGCNALLKNAANLKSALNQ
jgi:hypothetical protein